jgi:ketosteroid isomerase-like protein
MADPRHYIDRTYALFAAWSSGDPDAPRELLHEDAVLDDVIGGVYHGWPAIRAYFAHGLQRYPDLTLVPTGEFWHREDGVALTWVMSASVRDESFGPEAVGMRWQANGMSFLVFDGDLLVREVDYHDAGSRARSIETALAATRAGNQSPPG